MIKRALLLAACLFAHVLCELPVKHLNVFITRKELRRFFDEPKIVGDFHIIKGGEIAAFVKNQMTGNLQTISPTIHTLELRFQSKTKLFYKISMSSDDKSIMRTPTTTWKSSGQVPRKARPFKIRFPCNRRKSGETELSIKMEFMASSRMKPVLAQFNLKLRKECQAKNLVPALTPESQPPLPQPLTQPPPDPAKVYGNCEKELCTRKRAQTRFCLSDFAIRAKVEKLFFEHGMWKYRVRVTKRYKSGRVFISKKMIIEIIGTGNTTCKCSTMQPQKTYLILGKENRRKKSLFLDAYTFVIDWSDGGKKLAKLRKKSRECRRPEVHVTWHP